MTGSFGGTASEESESAAERMNAIAAGLRAEGLAIGVHRTEGVLDVTATTRPPGRREIELIVDDDGYVQVSWWCPAGATPHQIIATIGRVLGAITSSDVNPGLAAGGLS
jgi:hypothetical protein